MAGERNVKKIVVESWKLESDAERARVLIKNMTERGAPVVSIDNVMCYLVYNDMGIHTRVIEAKNLRATFAETSDYRVKKHVRQIDDNGDYMKKADGKSPLYGWAEDTVSVPVAVIDTAFGFLDKDLFELRGVLSNPIINKNGRLVVMNGLTWRDKDEKGLKVKKPVLNIYDGYDPVSQYFFAIPERVRRELAGLENLVPTAKQVKKALRFIDYFFCDFIFASKSAKLSAVAFMLTMFCRELIREASVPMLEVRAPETRSGKTLLVKMMLAAMTGEIHPGMFSPNFRQIEEFEKELFSLLLQGRNYIFMDNVTTKVQSSFLDMALTTGHVSKRVLSVSQEATVYSGMPFVMTANNPDVSEDIKGRIYLLDIMKPPEDKKYRHEGKEKDARAMGPAMLLALYILHRNWAVNYKGEWFKEKKIPGYEEWGGVIGGHLAAAGLTGFLEDTLIQIKEVDPRKEEAAELAAVWLGEIGSNWVQVKDVLAFAIKAGLINEKDKRQSAIQTIRNKLTRMRNVELPGGYMFQKNNDNIRGSEWRVVVDECQ